MTMKSTTMKFSLLHFVPVYYYSEKVQA